MPEQLTTHPAPNDLAELGQPLIQVGNGACIFIPNQTEPVRLKRPVTNRGSILLGELVAILRALEFAQIE